MDNVKTRFLDLDEKVPVAAKIAELEAEAELERHSELANLYYDQWVDGEMWKEFSVNDEDQ